MPNRVVLITGAAGGLGSVMTDALLQAAIAAVDRDGDRLHRLVQKFAGPAGEGRLVPIAADLSSEVDCMAAVERALVHFGRLDAVINNAGIGMRTSGRTPRRIPGMEEIGPTSGTASSRECPRPHAGGSGGAAVHLQARPRGASSTTRRAIARCCASALWSVQGGAEVMSAVWAEELKARSASP